MSKSKCPFPLFDTASHLQDIDSNCKSETAFGLGSNMLAATITSSMFENKTPTTDNLIAKNAKCSANTSHFATIDC